MKKLFFVVAILITSQLTHSQTNKSVNNIQKKHGVSISGQNSKFIQATSTVSGTIVYNNAASTFLGGILVNIMSGATVAGSATTDANGAFSISNINDGSYTIAATTTKPWGGVTATDALKMKRHIAGLELLTIPIRLTAADANASGNINSTDVLKVQRRVAGLDASFTRADWNFELTAGGNNITVSGGNVVLSLFGLCTGDVNGSNLPVQANKTKNNNIK